MDQSKARKGMETKVREEIDAESAQFDRLLSSVSRHGAQMSSDQRQGALDVARKLTDFQQSMAATTDPGDVLAAWMQYTVDRTQRAWLTLDALRARGNADLAHEVAGTPPVLDYAYDVVVDGRTLARPVNYQLLRIIPPKGVTVVDAKRPYMIIDPRAGHGAGIGGFKDDSQVGVALRAGHPVYFVVFRQHPEPGQTLADVTLAEADFLREIARRHPKARKAVVVGNCQGGWATLLLSATHPDLTGPLVINGAPVATWAGQVGSSPMRYNGGLLGGVVPALMMSDLGAGEFDGAHLVSNFEMLNPSRSFFGKYYDLFKDVDTSTESFLEFEKWWGAFHFTNDEEIRWIIEQLFVGNRLSRGTAQLEPGLPVDLKAIKAPIIVFASRGDNITPPQQALNWIADTFVDEREIRIRGQRIIYMVHEKVGHLGIFVSSSIAKKEHTQVTSTLKAIEALSPGLYEMTIDEATGEPGQEHFLVSFHDRKIADVLTTVENDRDLEKEFAAVARLSEAGAAGYEMVLRPFIQALVNEPVAKALRDAHPSRVSRMAFSDKNPTMQWVKDNAHKVRAERQPSAPDNPFVALESALAQGVSQSLDLYRDIRDASFESAFLTLYGLPIMRNFAERSAKGRSMGKSAELRNLPDVQRILGGIERGDIAAAVIRMLILLADSRGGVRKDRLERSAKLLHDTQPFAAMGSDRRSALIHEQSILVEFERERAMQSLPKLLAKPEDRRQAMDWIHFVVGERSDMAPHSLELIAELEKLLGVPFSNDRNEHAKRRTKGSTRKIAL
jgi:poly(3-hydroxyalkanoate) synthetase